MIQAPTLARHISIVSTSIFSRLAIENQRWGPFRDICLIYTSVTIQPTKRPNYLHSGKRTKYSENVLVSGLIIRCQRRSRERCKQQSKDCLVKVEGHYWGDVRQEHTNKVERQSVQYGYKKRSWYMEQNVGQLERRRRENCTQPKCACCGGQEEIRD